MTDQASSPPVKRLGRPVGTASAPDRRRAQDPTPAKRAEAVPFPEWCERHVIQAVDRWAGKPLILEPWQLQFMAEATQEVDGRFAWESVVLCLPRKNGKTATLAAYALWHLLQGDGHPEVLLAAASDRQAGRLFEQVVNYIRANPSLEEQVHLREYIGEISKIEGGGKILRMSSSPSTLHGYNPSLVICDELAFWTKPSQRKAWAALTTGGGARELSQTFVISTAGEAHERAASILGSLIDRNEGAGEVEKPHEGLTISRNYEAKTLIWNYSAPTVDASDVTALKKANPASWITEEWLARQAANPELDPGEILQLHGCVWSTSKSAWLREGLWDACADSRREIADGTEIVIGFDGSYNDDSTALIGSTLEEEPHLFVIGLWEKPQNSRDWIVPRDQVTATLDKAMERWKVVELDADPPGWHREILEWEQRYGDVVVTQFRTQMRSFMARACARMHSAVVNQKLTHDGNRRLAAHIGNAVTKETADGAYITKEYRASPRKIDAATASVIAFDRATSIYEQGQSVYEERGLLVLEL